MEAYHLYNVVPALFTFIEDLTNWYIRLNRSRFWGEGLDKDKCAAFSTLYTAIKELSTAMAPFTPFLSEHIYQELLKFDSMKDQAPLSVHLCDYPVADEKLINKDLEDAVERMQQIILLGRQKRNQAQVKVKTPLATLTIVHKDEKMLKEISKLESYIKTELNIKEIAYDQAEDKYIKLYAKPNLPVLGKRLGKEMGQYMKLIQNLSADQLAILEDNGSIELQGQSFHADDFLIFREAKAGTQALSNRFISINLDCTLNPALIEEGLAREVINRIQKSRKESGFNVDDRIKVAFQGSPEVVTAIKNHAGHIQAETLCQELSESADQLGIQFEIDDYQLSLALQKL